MDRPIIEIQLKQGKTFPQCISDQITDHSVALFLYYNTGHDLKYHLVEPSNWITKSNEQIYVRNFILLKLAALNSLLPVLGYYLNELRNDETIGTRVQWGQDGFSG